MISKRVRKIEKVDVKFIQEPTQMGLLTTDVIDDTCGKLI